MRQIKHTFLHILLLLFMMFSYNASAFSQVGIQTLDPKSTLDVAASVETTDIAGIQAPRLTLTQLAAKGNALYGSDQKGAIVYVTDASGGGNTGQRVNITIPGYYYFDGSNWQKLNPAQSYIKNGDIINSFKTSDHDGWYLLDGRAISGLSANARASATSLGFTTNLPDARDRVLRSKASTDGLGSTGGANTLVVAQANLPNTTLSGTITGSLASAGGHTHTASGTLTAGGAHTHSVSATLVSAGAHTHLFESVMNVPTLDVDRGNAAGSIWNYSSGTNVSTSSDGIHAHTVNTTLVAAGGHTHVVTGSLATTGDHTHTATGTASVPAGGSGTALDNRSPYLVVNTFIYLGQ